MRVVIHHHPLHRHHHLVQPRPMMEWRQTLNEMEWGQTSGGMEWERTQTEYSFISSFPTLTVIERDIKLKGHIHVIKTNST